MAPFKVGDVVACIRECEGPIETAWEPIVGRIYRVSELDWGLNNEPLINLFEDPCPVEDAGWEADAFRLLPKADEQFTEQMRALRPSKVSA